MNTVKDSGASGTSGTGFEITACSKGLFPKWVIGGAYTYNVESAATCATCATSPNGLRARLKARNAAGSVQPRISAVEHGCAFEMADLPKQPDPLPRTSKAELVPELQGGPVPSSALVELDRFFAAAVEHVFPDGTTGWIDPAHKFPAIEMVLCPAIGKPSPRASCTEHNGCPDVNTCKAFKRPLAGRK